jgi:hypothetical protein
MMMARWHSLVVSTSKWLSVVGQASCQSPSHFIGAQSFFQNTRALAAHLSSINTTGKKPVPLRRCSGKTSSLTSLSYKFA